MIVHIAQAVMVVHMAIGFIVGGWLGLAVILLGVAVIAFGIPVAYDLGRRSGR